jgi:hypothetical protein
MSKFALRHAAVTVLTGSFRSQVATLRVHDLRDRHLKNSLAGFGQRAHSGHLILQSYAAVFLVRRSRPLA